MTGRLIRLAAAAGLCILLGSCGRSGTADPTNNTRKVEDLSRRDIPECYRQTRLEVTAPTPGRAVFVLVDQTTGLDEHLRETVRDNLMRLIEPGTSFAVSSFSAFSRGRYTTIIDAGTVHAPLPQGDRSSLSVRGLERLDRCLSSQLAIAEAHADSALAQATSADSSSFDNSEIMASLAQLSEAVRASPAAEKIVIVVSDLLEHSGTTSFYRNRDIRAPIIGDEIAKAESHRLLGDFGNARVAIVGAGLLSPQSRHDAVRNAQALAALRGFWEEWFRRSNAVVTAYGQPDLVTPIQ